MCARCAALALLALCVLCGAAVPRCEHDACAELFASESNSGELLYNITGLEKNIFIKVSDEHLSLTCQDQDVEPAHLPRYPASTDRARVVLDQCGASDVAAVLEALRVRPARLELWHWRGELAGRALRGLRLAALHVSAGAVHVDALLSVEGLGSLTLEGGTLAGAAAGLAAGLHALDVRGVKGAEGLRPGSRLESVSVNGCAPGKCCACSVGGPVPALAGATGVRKLLVQCATGAELPERAPDLTKLTLYHAGAAPASLARWAPHLVMLMMAGGPAPALAGVRLETLRLNEQALTQLPAGVDTMRSLRSLDVAQNALQQLPALRLPLLQTLILDHNRLLVLPEMWECVSLQRVSARRTRLAALPARLPPSLRRLDVWGAPLERGPLPPLAVKVENVNCSREALSRPLRARYCPPACTRDVRADGVTELSCKAWPGPTQWPDGPLALRVERAGLQELPPWPERLRELYVSENALRTLPAPSAGGRGALDVLDARDNPLDTGAAAALLAARAALVTCHCDALLAALAAGAGVRCGARSAAAKWASCGAGAGAAAAAVAAAALAAGAAALYYKYRWKQSVPLPVTSCVFADAACSVGRGGGRGGGGHACRWMWRWWARARWRRRWRRRRARGGCGRRARGRSTGRRGPSARRTRAGCCGRRARTCCWTTRTTTRRWRWRSRSAPPRTAPCTCSVRSAPPASRAPRTPISAPTIRASGTNSWRPCPTPSAPRPGPPRPRPGPPTSPRPGPSWCCVRARCPPGRDGAGPAGVTPDGATNRSDTMYIFFIHLNS